MVDEVWRRLLASEEAQRLVERIAEAPELRAAISAQSVGFIEDVGHTIGDATRRLDGVIERVARRVLFRKRRSEPTERAGALTRGLAFGLDLLIVNLAFSGLAAIVASDRLLLLRHRQRRLRLRPGARQRHLDRPRRASTWSSSGRLRGRRRGCASSASGWAWRAVACRRAGR